MVTGLMTKAEKVAGAGSSSFRFSSPLVFFILLKLYLVL